MRKSSVAENNERRESRKRQTLTSRNREMYLSLWIRCCMNRRMKESDIQHSSHDGSGLQVDKPTFSLCGERRHTVLLPRSLSSSQNYSITSKTDVILS